MTWLKNPGRLPPAAKGKRVHVQLVNGWTTVGEWPTGWPADDKGACDWKITGSNWDISHYKVIT